MRSTLVTVLVATLLAVSGCGGDSSPTSPSGSSGSSGVNLAGNWAGSITFSRGRLQLRMSLVQSGSAITGSWLDPTDDDTRGGIAGSVSGGSFAGTMTITGCTGNAVLSGSAGGDRMAWTSAQGFLVTGFECDDTGGFTLTVCRGNVPC